jgi:serine/threonine-protein kinase RsbW
VSHRFEAVLRNDKADLASLPPRLEAFAEQAGLPPDVAMHIDVVLDELVANAIAYGYPDGRDGTIRVRLDVDGDVTVVVEDDGNPFDPTTLPPPDLESDLANRPVGGLGIHFVRTMMDEVAYARLDGRNRITLTKRLSFSGQRHASNS